jgi:hypothetical protein
VVLTAISIVKWSEKVSQPPKDNYEDQADKIATENHLRGNITHTRRSPVTQESVDEIVISEEGIERTPPFKCLERRTQEGNTARSLPEGALNPNVQRDFETACYSVDEGFLDEINAPPWATQHDRYQKQL